MLPYLDGTSCHYGLPSILISPSPSPMPWYVKDIYFDFKTYTFSYRDIMLAASKQGERAFWDIDIFSSTDVVAFDVLRRSFWTSLYLPRFSLSC